MNSKRGKDDSLAQVAAMMWGELEKLPAGSKLSLTAHVDDNPNNTSRTLFVFEARCGENCYALSATLPELAADADRGVSANAMFRTAVNVVRGKLYYENGVTNLSQNPEAHENPSK